MQFDPVCSASCLSSKAVEASGTALCGGSNLSLEVQRPQLYRGVMHQVGENSNDSTADLRVATDMQRIWVTVRVVHHQGRRYQGMSFQGKIDPSVLGHARDIWRKRVKQTVPSSCIRGGSTVGIFQPHWALVSSPFIQSLISMPTYCIKIHYKERLKTMFFFIQASPFPSEDSRCFEFRCKSYKNKGCRFCPIALV